ncbi:MAG: primosomal protein N' [Bacteroidaceae bacterium]|nr:primosomal protein N' [Bacteroidaceae bacterium]
MELFADIMLPVPLNRLFTYLVPKTLEQLVVPGVRVYVPFGKNRQLTGIVVAVHNNRPDCQVREIMSVPDGGIPSVLEGQLKLMKWMAAYCMCSPGDVMKAAIPAGLRPDSSANEHVYKPRTELFVRSGNALDGIQPADYLATVPKAAAKRREILEKYIELSGIGTNPADSRPVSKRFLSETCKSPSALKALVEAGILEIYEVETGRLPVFRGKTVEPSELSAAQQKALDDIRLSFRTKNVCLLHGVTSCGKTEIYIHLIKEQIERGRQVLYLLPEIALTTQIMHRLQNVFGDNMCVYHSKCADNIRVEVWKRLCGPDPYKLILGARSAVFLPLQNLGLVIVDEEHEPSFKQEDPAPRYHGRNTAVMLAAMNGARCLLGSATPAIESYSNAVGGKYGLVTLTERYRKIELPEICIVNTAELARKKYMKGLFSPQLEDAVREALQEKRQVILFHNRRGYAGTVECPDCGWVQKCDRCDVSLTWHKSFRAATCHYCGKNYQVPSACPSCGKSNLRGRGYGTERIEEDIKKLFPEARTARLDLDSSKSGYEDILCDFQEGRTDILIGTQMVSKGLDFNNVSVVGILQADSIMSYPDFRATERAYQLMAQVAGRAGRRDIRGKVILQTRRPDTQVLELIRKNDYTGFYISQMEERNLFSYPPYTRLVAVSVKGKDVDKVQKAADELSEILRNIFGQDKVLGPDAPQVSRIQFMHIRKIIIRISLDKTTEESRRMISLASDELDRRGHRAGITVSFDADPQ